MTPGPYLQPRSEDETVDLKRKIKGTDAVIAEGEDAIAALKEDIARPELLLLPRAIRGDSGVGIEKCASLRAPFSSEFVEQ